MVSEQEMIVVIETGSSSVSGAAGYKRPDGTLEVVAYASEPSGEFIKNGVVRNIDRTAQCLTNIINMLEGAMKNVTIDKVYVGLGGYTLHSIHSKVERGFDEETRVTAEMVESMFSDNEERIVSDKTVIEVIPQEYHVDSLVTSEPVGYNCRHIVGEYLNLMARFSTMDNLVAALDMAKLEKTDTLVTPVRLAEAILTPTERSLGCTLVDIGAGSTTVSVYKGGQLRFLSVVPLGDSLITSDLITLGIGDDEAERIKRTIGLTPADSSESTYRAESGSEISRKDIGLAIRARMQEILANAANQVKQSGYTDDKLSSGYIFTGGALDIPGARKYISGYSDFARVRFAEVGANISWKASECPSSAKQIALTALIAAGDENCVTITREVPKEIDYTDPNLEQGTLFTDEGEDAQTERDRQEAERKKADKEKKRAEAEEEKRRQKEAQKAARPKRKSLIIRIKEMRDNLTDLINDND